MLINIINLLLRKYLIFFNVFSLIKIFNYFKI